ncbi:MAG: methyltransferase [Gammaproteobacteria bacterium]
MHHLGPAWSPPAADILAELRAVGAGIDPGNDATLDLLDAAAEAWLQLATDEASGTEALLGMGQLHLWLSYFNAQNPLYAANNRLAALAAVRCLQNNLQDSTCPPPSWCLLEVGAGAGSGALALLHALAEADLLQHIALYRITEPNAFFRRRAERELKARYPELALEFGSLNIDQPWQEQGLAGQNLTELSGGGQGFDLIYSVNVLHVAKDLQFSLTQAAQRLKPTGWLVSGECLRPLPDQPVYTELMFRILDSYTQVTLDPAFRPNPGFLTARQWRTALSAAGLDQIRIEPDHELIRAVYPRFLLGALCAQSMRSG